MAEEWWGAFDRLAELLAGVEDGGTAVKSATVPGVDLACLMNRNPLPQHAAIADVLKAAEAMLARETRAERRSDILGVLAKANTMLANIVKAGDCDMAEAMRWQARIHSLQAAL